MSGTAIIGAQWGDEGKGKITHLLAEQSDLVVRYSGGPNAGHTVIHGGTVFKLHQIPSGVLFPTVRCVMGNGMVIDPAEMIREMTMLEEANVSLDNLRLAGNAHLILPYHRALDRGQEASRGDLAIGTTGRGIGPCYTDKVARRGVRAQDLLLPDSALADRVQPALDAANALLEHRMDAEPVALSTVMEQVRHWRERIGPHIGDGFTPLHEALESGASVLFEGAQGTLLDIDHGTYPYVTSSNPITGGVLTGSGVGPSAIDRVIGVAKAFQTRVGSGPMPTELDGEAAVRLRGTGEQQWDEFGTTTGRPRRVGWLDLVALRYSRRVNGLTELALTKLDILSGLDGIPVCTAYEIEGERTTDYPAQMGNLAAARPLFESLPSWSEEIMGIQRFDGLPRAAQDYVTFIEAFVGVPVTIISNGPAPEHTLYR
ncbi:MAG: adenylosuccinate synthase [Anaerolineales bacterium]|nr:adenylosuccinate synthase [Anaerolineales bacterium]